MSLRSDRAGRRPIRFSSACITSITIRRATSLRFGRRDGALRHERCAAADGRQRRGSLRDVSPPNSREDLILGEKVLPRTTLHCSAHDKIEIRVCCFDLEAVRRSLPIGAKRYGSKDLHEPLHEARRLRLFHIQKRCIDGNVLCAETNHYRRGFPCGGRTDPDANQRPQAGALTGPRDSKAVRVLRLPGSSW